MRINRIDVSQFKNLKNTVITFNRNESPLSKRKYNLNVLIGENGTSKTTILQIIYNSFANSEDEFKEINKRNDLDYSYKVYYTQNNKNMILDSSIERNLPESNICYLTNIANDNVSVNDQPSMYTDSGLTMNQKLSGLSNDIVDSVFNNGELFNYFSYLLNELHHNKRVSIYVEYKDTRNVLPRLKSSDVDSFGLYELTRKLRNMITTNSIVGTRYRYKKRYRLIPLENRKFSEEIFLLISEIVKISNERLSSSKRKNIRDSYRVEDFIRTIWIKTVDSCFPLQELSSGELNYLIQLVSLKKKAQDDSIILIDEPEVSLHPRWINGYISRLDEICNEKKCHVIIATHNPLIVNNLTSDELVILKRKDGRVLQESVYLSPTATSIDRVLEQVFRTNSSDSKYLKGLAKSISWKLESSDEVTQYEGLQMFDNLEDSFFKFELFRMHKLNLIKIKNKTRIEIINSDDTDTDD